VSFLDKYDKIRLMIKNSQKLKKFEDEYLQKEKSDISRNFQILDALFKEALALGIFPLKNPLEGIEVDIKIAKVVNSVSKTP
jgi:hypothetical protein